MRATSALAALAMVTAGLTVTAVTAPTAAAAVPAGNTVTVHADQPIRPVTHVATGSLYGLADATNPSDALAAAIKPNTFVQMPAGGHQQPLGDILKVAPKSERVGAKLVDRLSDYYPGFPYNYDPTTWFGIVDSQIAQVQAAGLTNLTAYAPWNEPDGTWKSAQFGSFEDFWTSTYREIRRLDPTTPIQGPSFSDNISDMQNFLEHAVATDTVPDILAWHELIDSHKIAGDFAKVEAIERDLGIGPLPVAIEEYAAPQEVGIAGNMVGYVEEFERLGARDAELAFWNGAGTLGDLLTGTGGVPNGAYWLYTWYAGMSGDMVATSGLNPVSKLAAFASVPSDKTEVDAVTGGGSGPTTLTIDGLNRLAVGKRVNVALEMTPSYGRTTPTTGPITISNTTYNVGSSGAVTVPIVMNPAYGYHVVVTPATGPKSTLAGTYTIPNLNSGLALDAAPATSGDTAVQQSTPGADTSSEVWKVVAAGSGLYRVVNAATGKLLTVAGAASTNGAAAVLGDGTGGDADLWQLVPDGKGHYRFENFGTGLVLSVANMSKDPGAPVITWTDGSVTSGCTATGPRQPGRIGTALSFCNTPSYVKLPTGAVSSLTGDFTVSAWVNPASNPQWARVFDIGSGSAASMFLTANAGGAGMRFAITTSGAGGEQRINAPTATLPLGQWSLVTVTVAGTTGTLYVNGQAVGTNPSVTVHPSAFGQSANNYIGKSQYSGDAPFNGAVDDFNVYDRALSASDVTTLAGGQVGDGDVVHYAFDEAGGAVVTDSSGNGRDGTVVLGNGSGTTTATDAATADHFWGLTPVTTAYTTLTSSAPPENSWYRSGVLVSLTSYVAGTQIQYRVDDGPWKTSKAPFRIAADGDHVVTDRLLTSNVVVDGSTRSFPVRIDSVAPTASVTQTPKAAGSPRNPVTLVFAAADATSGVAAIQYEVDGGSFSDVAAGAPVLVDTVGTHLIGYRAVDVAGNVSATRTVAARITADPATTLTLSARRVAAGGFVTVGLTGFHRYTTVDVSIGSAVVTSIITDVQGKASATIGIPADTPTGDVTVTASEHGGTSSASATLRVTAGA